MLSKLFSPAAMELNLKAQDQETAFRELVALVPHLDDGGRAGQLVDPGQHREGVNLGRRAVQQHDLGIEPRQQAQGVGVANFPTHIYLAVLPQPPLQFLAAGSITDQYNGAEL